MATLINADTSDGLKLTSDTSGLIEFQLAGVTKAGVNATGLTGDGSQLTGLPTPLAGNGPAFRATSSGSAQTISAATHTKILYPTEVFDTNSDYDAATSVFTPTVAGYYQVSGSIYIAGSQTRTYFSLYKNGSLYIVMSDTSASMTNFTNSGSALVEMNGTTDNIAMYVYTTQTSIGGSATRLWFSAHLARVA